MFLFLGCCSKRFLLYRLELEKPDHCSYQGNQGHSCLDECSSSEPDIGCMFLECLDRKLWQRNTSFHPGNAVREVLGMSGSCSKYKNQHTKCRSRNNLLGNSNLPVFRQLTKYTRCRNTYHHMEAMKNRRYRFFHHTCFQQIPVSDNFHL